MWGLKVKGLHEIISTDGTKNLCLKSSASYAVLRTLFFICSLSLFQERLKKLKSEHGKVQLGNITADMVHIYSCKFYMNIAPQQFDNDVLFPCSFINY